MPNTPVRAAAEGMPNLSRRRLLNLTGAGLALAATAMATKPSDAAPSAQVAELEAAFLAEWAALRSLEPALNAAELRYYSVRGKRPVAGEMTAEEVETLRRTTVAELATMQPSRASVEHAEALRAYNKADAAARRKTGYGKIDKAYAKATHRTSDAANALLRYPAATLEDLASKVRVHRIWEYDGSDFNFIMNDIARLAGMGGEV
ncbi:MULTISPECIES: hypothetical protein [unclassified Mesorhizobium]|uniref:hypothetical protein n=1 Tax=unclassified Mesorhizobium TaxID=325217 RepID=UPI00040995D0|nr:MULTISPECIES: hypothetical protein [unclassified Mesorhizobium]WJI52585.1 hypothetical protein NLY44_07930 [Mesorhizobium sp. C089B]